MKLEDIVSSAQYMNASYVFLSCNDSPKYKKDCSIEELNNTPLTKDECVSLAGQIIGEGPSDFEKTGVYETIKIINGIRCRVHISLRQGIPSFVILLIRGSISALETMGLPDVVKGFASIRSGLILITGEPDSGKTSTIASLVDYINRTKKKHVITFEKMIEYPIFSDHSQIDQKQIGVDIPGYSEGFTSCLHENPDVIVFDELLTKETIELAIRAAEAGCLVFSSSYISNTSEVTENMVQLFSVEEQENIRMRLSLVLEAVILQKLIPQKKGGRILACEIMVVNEAIRALIQQKRTSLIYNSIVASSREGGQLLDQELIRLCRSDLISRETAISYAENKDIVIKRL